MHRTHSPNNKEVNDTFSSFPRLSIQERGEKPICRPPCTWARWSSVPVAPETIEERIQTLIGRVLLETAVDLSVAGRTETEHGFHLGMRPAYT